MGSKVDLGVVVDHDEDEVHAAGVATVVDEDGPVAAATPMPGVVDEDVNPLDRLPPHAVTNADGSVTLPLKFPTELQIRKAGKIRTDKFDKLTFHRLTGADQRVIAQASDEMTPIVAFARSTRLIQSVMNALWDKMDAADIAAGGQVLNSFLSSGRTTGR